MLRMIQSLEFQSQALVLRSERQRLLASNMANADTPGYAARDMDFRRALLAATGGSDGGMAMTGGAGAQIAPLGSTDRASALADADLVYAHNSQDGLDNNKVDMDRERASWVENSVKYEATLRFINTQARALMDAMKAPGQG